jgi:hypothetical protein
MCFSLNCKLYCLRINSKECDRSSTILKSNDAKSVHKTRHVENETPKSNKRDRRLMKNDHSTDQSVTTGQRNKTNDKINHI